MLPRGLSGKSVGDYIDDVPTGAVVVIDNGGRLDATVWGDILTTVAHRDGVAGTVIDGVCRDVGRSIELGYPIFARANTMRTGKDRVAAAEAYGEPGNWPASASSPLTGSSATPTASWWPIRRPSPRHHRRRRGDHRHRGPHPGAVGGGAPLLAVRQRLHYHDLQTKR